MGFKTIIGNTGVVTTDLGSGVSGSLVVQVSQDFAAKMQHTVVAVSSSVDVTAPITVMTPLGGVLTSVTATLPPITSDTLGRSYWIVVGPDGATSGSGPVFVSASQAIFPGGIWTRVLQDDATDGLNAYGAMQVVAIPTVDFGNVWQVLSLTSGSSVVTG